MSLEIALGILMVLVMLSTVAAKYFTGTFVVRLKNSIIESDAELRNIRGQLKGLEAEAGIAKRNARTLEKKVTRLETRIVNHRGLGHTPIYAYFWRF